MAILDFQSTRMNILKATFLWLFKFVVYENYLFLFSFFCAILILYQIVVHLAIGSLDMQSHWFFQMLESNCLHEL
jgi:hypothetical protein